MKESIPYLATFCGVAVWPQLRDTNQWSSFMCACCSAGKAQSGFLTLVFFYYYKTLVPFWQYFKSELTYSLYQFGGTSRHHSVVTNVAMPSRNVSDALLNWQTVWLIVKLEIFDSWAFKIFNLLAGPIQSLPWLCRNILKLLKHSKLIDGNEEVILLNRYSNLSFIYVGKCYMHYMTNLKQSFCFYIRAV